jgi:heme-degrading monooxygenase HmoA
MIARIAETENLPADLDPEYVARHRAFIAAQPGFCGGYHLLDADTGRALSLTMWESDDALAAAGHTLVVGVSSAQNFFAGP